jgi:hypothetical protein
MKTTSNWRSCQIHQIREPFEDKIPFPSFVEQEHIAKTLKKIKINNPAEPLQTGIIEKSSMQEHFR